MSIAGGEVLGLIAGCGSLPFHVARSAQRRGRRIAAVAFHGHTDPEIGGNAEEVTWLHPGEVDAGIEALLSAGVSDAVMAGKVPKTALYGDPAALRLDARGRELIAQMPDRSDVSILVAVAEYLQHRGIRLLPQAELVPELLPGAGPLGESRANESQLADIAYAARIAKAAAPLGMGQTVAVLDRAVVAVEAIEGTDACIRRAGALCRGASVAKVASPAQDPRFDVPTIGPDTGAALVEAGIGALAFEAGKTLVLERDALVEITDPHGIALLGFDSQHSPGD